MTESSGRPLAVADREAGSAAPSGAAAPELSELEARLNAVTQRLETTPSASGSKTTHLAALEQSAREALDVARSAVDAARRAEALREAAAAESEAKDEFLGLLSHELRTPVGGVLIWTQLLRTAGDDHAAAARAADMIERSTRSLIQLVNDVLDASRIVAGKLMLEVHPVDLEALISAAVEGVLPAAEAKRILVHRVPAEAPTEVAGDPGRLQQVLVNLLSNAVKFTPQGGRIEVALEIRGGEAAVRVQDEGPGIEPSVLAHLFEPRPRGAGERGGLGLGLIIARHLVELHHGSLEVDSRGTGTGSTFTVKLPVLPAGAGRRSSLAPVEPMVESVEGLHVLLVDDEEGARAALGAVLELRGARVVAVSSCREALAHLDAERPDVLLSDIAMPVEDGYDLIRQVRQRERDQPLPAVAVTAYAAAEHRQKALSAGFQEHIPKPVDPDHLIRVLARVASGAARVTPLRRDSRP
jgi:signal transduction histidine kinase/CheY-like chemotaxis protein